MSADYPISRISSSEQLRIPLTDKTGDTTGELTMSVNTGGYGSKSCHVTDVFEYASPQKAQSSHVVLSHIWSTCMQALELDVAQAQALVALQSQVSTLCGHCFQFVSSVQWQHYSCDLLRRYQVLHLTQLCTCRQWIQHRSRSWCWCSNRWECLFCL